MPGLKIEGRGLGPVDAGKVPGRKPAALARVVVPGPDLGAAGGKRLGRGEAGLAEAEDRDRPARGVGNPDHRSFKVASPASARIAAMIQKRMTMVGSAHPFFSKW